LTRPASVRNVTATHWMRRKRGVFACMVCVSSYALF
jgi:hypothetical protein